MGIVAALNSRFAQPNPELGGSRRHRPAPLRVRFCGLSEICVIEPAIRGTIATSKMSHGSQNVSAWLGACWHGLGSWKLGHPASEKVCIMTLSDDRRRDLLGVLPADSTRIEPIKRGVPVAQACA